MHLSNMRGCARPITLAGSAISNIVCLGATMPSAIFFSSYADKLNLTYIADEENVEGPHSELMERFRARWS
jgi:hypothetical protein